MKVNVDVAYRPSENIVARKIHGNLIIVPLTAGVGEVDDDLYTLNETGEEIWDLLDGRLTVKEVAGQLAGRYESSPEEIEGDVNELVGELLRRGILV